MKYWLIPGFLIIGAALYTLGCAKPPVPAITGNVTVGQLASTGRTIFSDRCSRCHGKGGQGATGPAIIGPNANLAKYGNAQELLTFIGTAMPFNTPGSLSRQEYLQVLCFLLTENKLVPAGTVFDESKLGGLVLKSGGLPLEVAPGGQSSR